MAVADCDGSHLRTVFRDRRSCVGDGQGYAESAPAVVFAIAAGVQVVVQGLGRLWLRHKERLEGGLQPADERDLAIEYGSVRAAYGVLIAGMILVGCVMPFNSSGWRIVNAALAMIVAAEVVHYATVVFSYRRYA